ncbi:hypothetical protein BU26DRAFT_518384 [Trematosphaeria pertusa]|uniref:Uncharacterized protein n=1 Tax=Trematosphaeria pertusa TaxID=390896 RepID=A0A6A6IJW3_9PLEO|nr:uncharacterized protein BU26DRAFT_518384 [Trematosphaeria pertusa]KAF2249860.1 hypothetical protein BU26DRAFT_518384 [Trematosphaeria pertusa]
MLPTFFLTKRAPLKSSSWCALLQHQQTSSFESPTDMQEAPQTADPAGSGEPPQPQRDEHTPETDPDPGRLVCKCKRNTPEDKPTWKRPARRLCSECPELSDEERKFCAKIIHDYKERQNEKDKDKLISIDILNEKFACKACLEIRNPPGAPDVRERTNDGKEIFSKGFRLEPHMPRRWYPKEIMYALNVLNDQLTYDKHPLEDGHISKRDIETAEKLL